MADLFAGGSCRPFLIYVFIIPDRKCLYMGGYENVFTALDYFSHLCHNIIDICRE